MKKVYTLLILFISFCASAQTFYAPVVIKKTLRVDKRVAIGMTDFTEDLNITADTILILGLDGTGNILTIDGSGNVLRGTAAGVGAIISINGLTASTQTFATGTSGSDFNISSSGSTHTFNLPSASSSVRGVVTTGTQQFAGNKTFDNDVSCSSDLNVEGITTLGSGSGSETIITSSGNLSTLNGVVGSSGNIVRGISGSYLPLTTGTSGQLLRVNAGETDIEWFTPSYGTVTSVGLTSSDLTITGSPITTSGSFTAEIASGVIVNADINASAAISYSKLNLTGAVLNADLAGSIDATKINTGVVSNTEFNRLDGVTADIQTQLDAKTGYVGTPVNLTAQAAAIAATTAYTTPAADGYYRINITVTITRAATVSSQIGFQVKYTDANDNVVKTSNNVNNITQSTANATGTMLSFSYPVYVKASTNIQYVTAYSSVGATAMNYDISVIIEKIK